MDRIVLAVVVIFVSGCGVAEHQAAQQQAQAAAQAERAAAQAKRAAAAKAQNAAATAVRAEEEQAAPADFADVPAALSALQTALPADDQKTIRAATLWLSQQGAAAVEPVSAEVQKSEHDLKYRLACLNVLGFLGPPAAPALLEATDSQTPQIRVKATDLLGSIQPSSGPIVTRLIALLDDSDNAVQRSAIQSLGRIGKPAQRATPKLQDILNSDADDSLRGAAKIALKKVDPRVGFRKD